MAPIVNIVTHTNEKRTWALSLMWSVWSYWPSCGYCLVRGSGEMCWRKGLKSICSWCHIHIWLGWMELMLIKAGDYNPYCVCHQSQCCTHVLGRKWWHFWSLFCVTTGNKIQIFNTSALNVLCTKWSHPPVDDMWRKLSLICEET